jgi:hypothetical protein
VDSVVGVGYNVVDGSPEGGLAEGAHQGLPGPDRDALEAEGVEATIEHGAVGDLII